jgi:hypothetical protein
MRYSGHFFMLEPLLILQVLNRLLARGAGARFLSREAFFGVTPSAARLTIPNYRMSWQLLVICVMQ